MSQTKVQLELSPSKNMATEHIRKGGFDCPQCCGNGWHWAEDGFGERYKEPCKHCHGSGKVSAEITIEWK